MADYVVAGSGPLLAHGLRDVVDDLDIVARGAARKTVLELGDPQVPPSGHGSMVTLFAGDLEIFDRWLPDSPGPDRMIEAAECAQGIPFSPLSGVLTWKERLGGQKDQDDIELIRDYPGQAGG
ncbi:hypothetical protein QQY24_12685 [Streptomyces sp. TG1A-8]|uniref:hypothetical protein n=1 Tax=Streptomyces sp. TG1A-8 TaxID=3051385 RepID=UPI00265BD85A|nr:hypothetical protein [Streptomyces sp. TG1A-8]MDO0926243.1 hypothetical protein [Streptomyces sp. TG1A-8]